MYYYVNGTVAEIDAGLAVIDCSGVGYACATTNYTLSQLKKGAPAKLYTYLNVREDAMELFGFADQSELRSFKLLIGVSGVGPRAALSILSAVTPQQLALAVVTEDTWKAVRTDLRRKMRIDVPGTGIAFTVPLSSIGGRRALMFLTQHQPLTLKEESTLKDTRYELLLVIANQGHTGTIMDAARAAGAGGGTVIHAKGTGMEGAAQFLGVELVNEKELVLIVARTPEKNRIMKAIMDGAGPKAGAIVFSLPVTDTAGLRLLEDEEPVQETSAQ